jgi:hypothetical protein
MLEGRKLKAAIRRQAKFDENIAKAEGSWDRRSAECQMRDDTREAYRKDAQLARIVKADERRAERAANRTTTCQVCGRPILANTGVIAHHGYERPRDWYSQTASCPGARFVPYEESCDRLKEVAELVGLHVTHLRENRSALLAPLTLSYQYKTGHRRNPEYETRNVFRPVDFKEGDYYGEEYSYASVLYHKRTALDSEIRNTVSDLAMMNSRIVSWIKVR